jgi:hypothetical protein
MRSEIASSRIRHFEFDVPDLAHRAAAQAPLPLALAYDALSGRYQMHDSHEDTA